MLNKGKDKKDFKRRKNNLTRMSEKKEEKNIYRMKVRVNSHRLKGGKVTFTVTLPVRCGVCGFKFKNSFQVGVSESFVICPFCYTRSRIKIRWHMKRGERPGEKGTAEVILIN